MKTSLPVPDFLEAGKNISILDVRTPSEFAQGHIPGAHSLPLFSDEERAAVGTLYKERGQKPAQLLGLEYVGPKMRAMVEEAERLAPNGKVLVHCWRGGMRSASVAWLLKFYGFETSTLEGGYKFFRRWVLGQFEIKRSLRILGGLTGSGKTTLLKSLGERGEQIADLEGLAGHRGSAFGTLGMPAQPTSEQFENALALVLAPLHPDKPLWLEDESRMIGKAAIPTALWLQMRKAPLYLVEKTREERVENLVRDYGSFSAADLSSCVERISKKLGGALTTELLVKLAAGERRSVCEAVLDYYDRTYLFALKRNTGNAITRVSEKELLSAP
ncbi:MAG: tRNA 2-selenouridine(34) synthase MnmH [Spirochaetia bacterium]|nr:tRNA 2-selenouridine(34) synthase MnmH [Spirochaetia bacterium]